MVCNGQANEVPLVSVRVMGIMALPSGQGAICGSMPFTTARLLWMEELVQLTLSCVVSFRFIKHYEADKVVQQYQ